MVRFKDIIDKAKEAAKKGIEMVSASMEFEKLLSDFDEYVANTLISVLSGKGFRGMRQEEKDNFYIVEMAVEDESKVKHIIDRDIMRNYSPKDREKILQIIPDKLVFQVRYMRKKQPAPTLFQPVKKDDVEVGAWLYYFVERKGGLFSKVKRDTRKVYLGSFGFKSSDFVNYDERSIDTSKLESYLENKLRGLGIL